ncbi:MAG: sel1 repeat family protein [Deltaproteobacteria bacterium]|nr:sel1 repeat family protein [Deltaproteobacteria bacterium]MBW2534636.1 sel1 repeat family protein [Deltaproteobacteria bacterium]
MAILCAALLPFALGCDKKDGKDGAKGCTLGAVAACKKTCDGGKLEDCMLLGRSYQMGEPTFDRSGALAVFLAACKKGHGPACHAAAKMVDNKHFEKTHNPGAAKELLKKACDAKLEQGCVDLIMKDWGSDAGKEAAFKAFDARCKKGEQLSCKNLGWMYRSGHHVKEDEKKSFEIFKKSCEAGGQESCGELATAYVSGYGVGEDKAKAKEILTKACAAGSASGCMELGLKYRDGAFSKESKTDYKNALVQYKKACDMYNDLGCTLAAQLYQSGEEGVVEKDLKLALKYFTRGCNLGFESPCEDAALIDVATKLKQDAPAGE